MWTAISPIGSNIGRAFFLSYLDTMPHLWYSIRITKEKTMTDQTDQLIAEVQSKNRGENYERENTIKLHELQDIWKETNQLDNITAHLMRKFNSILRGGIWWSVKILIVKMIIKMLVVGNLQIHEVILVV
jgi:hypothetical protein